MKKIHRQRRRWALSALAVTVPLFFLPSCLILDGSYDDRSLLSFRLGVSANPSLRLARDALISQDEIDVYVPDYVDASSLAPDFTYSGLEVRVAGVLQESGVTRNDFTKALVYSVRGKDDRWTDYRVVVSRGPANSGKSLYIDRVATCTTNTQYYHWYGPYWQGADRNTWTIPYREGIDISKLKVSLISDGIKVEAAGDPLVFSTHTSYIDANNAANQLDFSNPVDFVVTAEDMSTATYTYIITSPPTLDSFSISTSDNPRLLIPRTGAIDEAGKTVSIDIPNYMDPTALIPSFTYSGEGIEVLGQPVVSDSSTIDLSHAQQIALVGRYGQNAVYTIVPTLVEPDSAKALVSIEIGPIVKYGDGFYYSVSTHDLVHSFSSTSTSVPLYHLYVQPQINGVSIAVTDSMGTRDLKAYSGNSTVYDSNFVDFSGPVTFVVSAEDGSRATYFADITK